MAALLRYWFARAAPFLAASANLGCERTETKACLENYEAAQRHVLGVDAKAMASVKDGLAVVEKALEACRTAGRHTEVDQLTRARNELSAQIGALDRRARRKGAKPSSEQIARLQKEGDPSCPRGQAYRLEGVPKEIRCSGPFLIEMSLEQVRAHFDEQDYRVRSRSPSHLAVERGAERYDFHYGGPASSAPTCVVLVPAPGLPWREAVARATGTSQSRLKNPGSVRVAQGSVPYTVDEDKSIVKLGDCPAASGG